MFVNDEAAVKTAASRLQEIDKQIQAVKDAVPKLPILRELAGSAKRSTRVHKRGSFLDPGDEVSAAVLPLFDVVDARSVGSAVDRLAAARGIVYPGNPLAARVA
ncbi:MAG: hypothetical protein ACKOAH_29385, partial [Pirellula sp.]